MDHSPLLYSQKRVNSIQQWPFCTRDSLSNMISILPCILLTLDQIPSGFSLIWSSILCLRGNHSSFHYSITLDAHAIDWAFSAGRTLRLFYHVHTRVCRWRVEFFFKPDVLLTGLSVFTLHRGGGAGGAGGAIAPPNISVGEQRSPNFAQALFCIYRTAKEHYLWSLRGTDSKR